MYLYSYLLRHKIKLQCLIAKLIKTLVIIDLDCVSTAVVYTYGESKGLSVNSSCECFNCCLISLNYSRKEMPTQTCTSIRFKKDHTINQISTEGVVAAGLSYKIVAPCKIMSTFQQLL